MNKSEIKYIAYAIIFALVVFGYVIPQLVSNGIETINPYYQFLIFNISIFIFLQFFLKAVISGNGVKISGAIGIITLFMALDILMPPLLVTTSGELMSNVVLSASAADYIFGHLYSSLGIEGFILYLAVYVLTPLILLIISAKLLPNFVRKI